MRLTEHGDGSGNRGAIAAEEGAQVLGDAGTYPIRDGGYRYLSAP